MMERSSPHSLLGMAAIHSDGDAGVITQHSDHKWEINFVSGYRGIFPKESVNDKSAFLWFPTDPSPNTQHLNISPAEKLGVLAELLGLIRGNQEAEAREKWETVNAASWLPIGALDAAILKQNARAARKHREKIIRKLQRLMVEEAEQIYGEIGAKAWWPQHEFAMLAERAREVRDWVRAYPSTSLSGMDNSYLGLFSQFSGEEYARLKLPKLALRLARLGMPLNEEQQIACARPERNRLIRARAGSGKTRTLAALAALTIHDESLNPDQVLVLAFNKKAANEIGERISGAAGIDDFRNARTFHSLAYQLADHAGRELIFDDGNLSASRRKQTGFVERLIGTIISPAFRERLYEFFRRELEQLDRLGSNLSGEEYTAFRRAMTDYTLGGETVKSNGEKFIADFLFEHGIAYKYEKVWSWERQERLRGSPYRPDFSLIDAGREYIIEHWAINPDDQFAQVPDWWETKTQDYREQIGAKRKFWAERRVALLETHSAMLYSGRDAFERSLKALLERAGIRCVKLQHNELVRRVAEAPRTVSRLAALFLQFISRAKKRGWTVEDVAQIIRDTPDPEPRNRAFHELAVHAYAAYEKRLTDQSAIDFDDLLISAAACVVNDGGASRIRLDQKDSVAIRDLRWILIDEFQDFSELYYRLIKAILDVNPSIRVVAVGDDWQAINGFAGAQLTYFNSFGDYFSHAGTATIATNRRSGRRIVGAGNLLMDGHGPAALAYHSFDGDIFVVSIDKVWLEERCEYLKAATSEREDGRSVVNWELAKALKACTDFIAESVYPGTDPTSKWMPSVLILSRTDRAYGVTLAEFGRRLAQVLNLHTDLQDLANEFFVGGAPEVPTGAALIDVMTAHKAKGKEADTVIVLEAVSRQFPKIHADNQLFGPFGVTAEDVLAEERRLFYVAATRAQHRLMLLSETDKESPYVSAVLQKRRAASQSGRSGAILDAEAAELQRHLEASDRKLLIRMNVSEQAKRAWDRIAGRMTELPEVGFSLGGELHAELAWPNQKPPVAILSGRFKAHAEAWRDQGWTIA